MHHESRANDNYIRLACTTNEKKKREKDYQVLSAQRRRIDRDPITCPSRVIKNKVYRGEEVEIIGSLKRGRNEQL